PGRPRVRADAGGQSALTPAARTALGALTPGGRAFVSSGVTAVFCSFLLGLEDLARVGALLVAVPLLSAVVTTRGRHKLGLARTVEPAQVTVDQVAHVDLQLSNEGRAPTGLLLVEEQVPYALGVRPRFVIDRMGPHWRRSVRYAVRSELRGRYTLGPMTVRVNDPFGLVALVRSFQSSAHLVVTPEVVPLPAIPLSGTFSGTGEHRPRSFAGGSAEDVTTREYRHGDDLRRVHWRSSAHAGELMVRREEQPWESRATLFVDNRRFAHRGTGAASSLEHAVSVAASVAVHLVQRGFSVRLVTAAGVDHSGQWHERELSTETAPLLESLAVLTDITHPYIDVRWLSEAGHSGLLIAVLGDIAEHDQPVLTRMRHSAAGAMAFALDVPAWARGSSGGALNTARNTSWLGAHGWRAV